MERFISSTIGVSCAELITFPICTVKTIYQSQNVSILESIKQMKKNPINISKATVPATIAQIYTSAYKFSLFNYFQQYLDKTWQLLLLGSCVSVSSLAITHPLDYIRINLQVSNKIIFSECFKGLTPNVMKQTVAGASYLPVRQSIKNNFPDIKSWQAGVIAACIGTILVHPFDYFKTYLMGNPTGSKINFSKPYRGLHLNLMRIIPHFVIMTECSDYIYSKLI